MIDIRTQLCYNNYSMYRYAIIYFDDTKNSQNETRGGYVC